MSTVGDVRAALDAAYPARWAAPWDTVGAVCGSDETKVEGVLLAIDATPAVIDEAVRIGANVLVTHHPMLFRGITAVEPGGVLERCISAGIAVHSVHTNGDVARPGTSDTLWRALGLPGEPDAIEPAPADELDLVHVYVRPEDRVALAKAMADAGAGRIGAYEQCAYWTSGTGQFVAGADANPTIGERGELVNVAEDRLEMVCERAVTAQVVAALHAAHVYEEPAYGVSAIRQPNRRGFGRIGDVEPITLAELSSRAVAALPATAGGVRVAGEADRVITRVAVAAGAGDDAIEAAAAQGAKVLITSDLRHHRTLDGLALGLSLLDVAHWAAEWPWLQEPARVIRTATNVEVVVSSLRTDPWSDNCRHQGASE